MENSEKVRVRFAPSPTGPFSLGNARTALFNWIYARAMDGSFLIRVEDTDKERSKKEYEEEMLESLKWLGLDWDEEIERQSERTEIYKKHLESLLDKNHAYYCFCDSKTLEEERQAQLSQGLAPKYSGKCSSITQAEAKERVNQGENSVIRFRVPTGKVSFDDIIRGKVEFDTGLIGDFVIAKDLSSPLYNFAVVIDDNDMNITHVIRGEDHISNTPRQVIIQKVLGFNELNYAHLPLILAPGGKKLSKRDMEGRSMMDYKNDGYLKEAIFNFLLLLGWHPKEDREVVTKDEAIKEFSLKRVQKSGAVLNEEKLNWYNSHYIKEKNTEELFDLVKEFIPKEWLEEEDKLKKIIGIEKSRINNLTELKEVAKIFFELPSYDGDLLIWKDKLEQSKDNLRNIYKFILNLDESNFKRGIIEEYLNKLSDEAGGKGQVFWPFRVALSGQKSSPGVSEMLEVLGKKEVVKRLEVALEKID
ncbi:MAG: glutamate--tRNA ligase [Candidatus Paceibacterota bacterium]